MKTKRISKEELMARIAKAIEKSGSQKNYAGQVGVSPAYLNDILMGNREPGNKILEGMNLKRVVSYEEVK